jgi:hypothetical protein
MLNKKSVSPFLCPYCKESFQPSFNHLSTGESFIVVACRECNTVISCVPYKVELGDEQADIEWTNNIIDSVRHGSSSESE